MMVRSTDEAIRPTIDPLPQYGSHAFLLYESEYQTRTSTSTIASTPSTQDRESLKLHITSSWTYCGPLLLADPTSLPPSFHIWSLATVSSPSILLSRLLPFLKFIRDFLQNAGAQHYWLTIRATQPTHDYDKPRWHTDDHFFTSASPTEPGLFGSTSASRNWKLATNLLGPRTLFLRHNNSALALLRQTKAQQRLAMGEHTCTSMRCAGCSTYVSSVRESLATSLSDYDTESADFHQAAFFRTGDTEGAVHSEPKCNVDRIFVNVVPGTQDDLEKLLRRWGMGFPRAWCFGVPVEWPSSNKSEYIDHASAV